MKASDKPEISKKWWLKEKPADIKGKDLESALAECEKSLGDVKKKEDSDTIAAALDSLEELKDAVKKTVSKECDKKKHKDLITVLEKYYDLIDDQAEEFEKAQTKCGKDADGEDEDSEEEKGVLKPEYLDRMIKQLRSGNVVQFCFGLNKQVADGKPPLTVQQAQARTAPPNPQADRRLQQPVDDFRHCHGRRQSAAVQPVGRRQGAVANRKAGQGLPQGT